MNRLFTLFAALLVGVVASAQLHIFEALNANNNFALTKCNMYADDTYWDVTLSYDSNGKISKMTSSYEDEEYDIEVYNRTYQYDEKGNKISSVELMEDNDEWEAKENYENNYVEGILTGYVVKYYDSFQENNYLYIIMEYCSGGDLFSYLEIILYLCSEFQNQHKICELLLKVRWWIITPNIHRQK